MFAKRLIDEIGADGLLTQASIVLMFLCLLFLLADLYYLWLSYFIFSSGKVMLELDLAYRDDVNSAPSVN